MARTPQKARSRQLILHPLLFAVYPPLFMFAHNADQLSPDVVLAPAGITLGAAVLLWALLALVSRSLRKAAFAASLTVVLFFSYGPLLTLLKGRSGPAMLLARSGVYPAVWAAALLAGLMLILKSRRDFRAVTSFANAAALVLVVFSLINGARGYLAQHRIALPDKNLPGEGRAVTRLPDIYYLIMDKYARQDILDEVYRFDNSDFVSFLRQKGFYVAGGSFANYCQTYISMASSLNYTYLDEVAAKVGVSSRDKTPLIDMMNHSRVAAFLKKHGYLFVNFASGYYPTEFKKTADRFMSPGWALNEFQNELVNMTPLLPILARTKKKSPYDLHRERILYTLDRLPDIARLPRPTFTFAHVILPHPPYVFDENGGTINPKGPFSFQGREYSRKEYIRLYKKQLAFTNRRLKETVEGILRNSPEPPIIIIQADHGPGNMTVKRDVDLATFNVKERMAIMNAIYLPDGPGDLLYDTISPVNTFRVIFNRSFGADLPLLPDKAWFSQYQTPYLFIDVTDRVGASAPAR